MSRRQSHGQVRRDVVVQVAVDHRSLPTSWSTSSVLDRRGASRHRRGVVGLVSRGLGAGAIREIMRRGRVVARSTPASRRSRTTRLMAAGSHRFPAGNLQLFCGLSPDRRARPARTGIRQPDRHRMQQGHVVVTCVVLSLDGIVIENERPGSWAADHRQAELFDAAGRHRGGRRRGVAVSRRAIDAGRPDRAGEGRVGQLILHRPVTDSPGRHDYPSTWPSTPRR